MPLTNILEMEIFDVQGIDFMGPFQKVVYLASGGLCIEVD